MTLSRNQKIAIGVGSALILGTIIYFAFIRKADDAISAAEQASQDPTMSGGTSGGQGGTPAGTPSRPGKLSKPRTAAEEAALKAGVPQAGVGRG